MPDRLFRAIIPPIVLPIFLASADGTAVATALPAIGAAFGEVEALQWVVVANLIASTIASPVYGRLGDMFGRRRLMIPALGLFVTASALCSVAPGLTALIACRALQGLGAGGLMVLAQALVGENVPARALGKFQGYIAGCIVAGSTFGPVGGGLLTSWLGWRAVFLANIPLGLLAIGMVTLLPRGVARARRARLDLAGMVLLTASVVPLLLALSRVRSFDRGAVPAIAALLLAASVALPLFLWQQGRAAAPLLPLGLLRHPAIWRANVMSAGSGASLVAMVTFLPIYFQVVLGATPAVSGLLLLPLTAGVSGGSVLTGFLVSRTGRTAILPSIGLAVTAATLVLLALFATRMSPLAISVALALGGVCQGTSMLVAQVTVQVAVAPGQLGVAAGAVQLARSLGSAFGVALAGAALFAALAAMDPRGAALFGELLRHGPGLLAGLGVEERVLVQGEIGAAFRALFLTVACFSCAIVAAAVTQPVRRVDRG